MISAEGDVCANYPSWPKFTRTNDTFSKRGTFESGQPQIAYLDGAGGAGDEDVVTLEVPVDDGRSAGVQEVKPFEDLTTPALQQLQLHLLKPFQVPKTKEDKTKLPIISEHIKTLEEEKVPLNNSCPILAAKRKFLSECPEFSPRTLYPKWSYPLVLIPHLLSQL